MHLFRILVHSTALFKAKPHPRSSASLLKVGQSLNQETCRGRTFKARESPRPAAELTGSKERSHRSSSPGKRKPRGPVRTVRLADRKEQVIGMHQDKKKQLLGWLACSENNVPSIVLLLTEKNAILVKHAISLAANRGHHLVTSTVYEKQSGKGQNRGLPQSLNGQREVDFISFHWPLQA